MSRHAHTAMPGLCAFVCIAVTTSAAAAQGNEPRVEPSVVIDVAPPRGTLDDVFTVSVRIRVADGVQVERYDAPALQEFRVVSQISNRTVQIDGSGLAIADISHHYTLAPQRAGLLRVGGAGALVAGRWYRARAQMIEVATDDADADDDRTRRPPDGTKAMRSGRHALIPPELPPDRPPPEIFVHAQADRESVYVGQQVTVTWVLYTRHELIEFEPQVPRTDDFWTEILYEPATFVRQGEIHLSGHRYQVVVVSRRALFPLRTGTLRIEPYRARAAALYTPLGTQAVVASEPLEIQARPLPPGAPADFDDTYVGLFKVSATADRTNLIQGESLVLTLNVRGHGAIRRTTPPRLELADFEVERSPDFEENVQSTDKTAIGVRRYRYWLTPTRTGELTVPAIGIAYLDPRDGAYKRAQSQPIGIRVTPDATAAASNADPRADNARSAGQSIRWWIPVALFAFALVSIVLAYRAYKRQQHGQPEGQARHPRPRARFRQAETLLREGRYTECFAELAGIIDTALQARLDLPARPLTRDRSLALLRERGLDPDLVERIDAELERYDLARFAASRIDEEEMKEALARARELVAALDDERG